MHGDAFILEPHCRMNCLAYMVNDHNIILYRLLHGNALLEAYMILCQANHNIILHELAS